MPPLMKLFGLLVYWGGWKFLLCVVAAVCFAIWWFVGHGWPDLPQIGFPRDKIQIYLFMAAPWTVLMAIVAFVYRNNGRDNKK